MKISKLFHWLYATLMFLPLLVVPIFGIYSHRHTIDSYSIEVPNYQKVDFNQHFEYNDFSKEFSYNDDNSRTYNYGGYMWQNHIYIISFEVSNLVNPNNNRFAINVGQDSGFYVGTLSQNGFIQYRGLCPSTGNVNYMYLVSDIGVTLDCTFTFSHYNIYDLTQMFGIGNEPSLSEFNTYFPNDFYSYTSSNSVLLEVGSITYNDTDIGSQFVYTIYGTLDKYFNFSKVFGLNQLGEYMYLNWFYGNSYIGFSCFFSLLTYWLLISLCWLIFDLLMYVPNLVHRWLDRGAIQ